LRIGLSIDRLVNLLGEAGMPMVDYPPEELDIAP